MIIVRHLSGARAGSEDRLDPKLDRIVFGRRMSCEVVFPPEEALVAREHFALERKPPGPSGHWTIELFGEPFVAVNGLPADPGQRLPPDATFELGRRGGPSFSVHLEADAAEDNLPITLTQEKDEGARAAAAKARSAAAWARRIGFAGLAAAVIAGAAAAYFRWTEAKPGISEAIRAHLLRATFLVEAPAGRLEGTAFPVGPHTLATNAHIGELFKKLRPGQVGTVRSPGQNGKTYRVVGFKIHPGYEAFNAFLRQDIAWLLASGLGVPGYDVATLTVKERLPADTILKLATNADLRALKPGTALATAGYPSEGIVGSPAQAYGATPEYHTGTVTGLTNFFFLPAGFAHSQLIHHSVPAAGGSSGSPMVDASGRVVALLSAGNAYQPGPHKARVPSGVLINYGQRVDFLRQLLAGTAGREAAQDRKYWAKEYAVFSSGVDIVDRVIFSRIRDAAKDHTLATVRISEATASFTQQTRVRKASGGFQRQIERPVAVVGGRQYVLIAYDHDGSPLQLWLYEGQKILAHDPIMGQTFLPWLLYKPAKTGTLSLWLVHPKDADATYTFQLFRVKVNGVGTAANAKSPSG